LAYRQIPIVRRGTAGSLHIAIAPERGCALNIGKLDLDCGYIAVGNQDKLREVIAVCVLPPNAFIAMCGGEVIYRTDESQAACPWRDGRAVSETIGGMTAALELNDNTNSDYYKKERRSTVSSTATEVAWLPPRKIR
jgi:hypothetical protein